MSFYQFLSRSDFEIDLFLFKKNEPISCVMDVFSSTGSPCALVIDSERKILGTISDGDIRKGLRSGFELEDAAYKYMNPNPLVLGPSDLFCTIKREALRKGIDFFPVCDANNVVIDIYRIYSGTDFVLSDSPLVIMAGGFGKRMGELTANTPKPLLSIRGKPIIEHIIDQAVRSGFYDIFITVHFEKDQIIQAIGDGRDRGVSIRYIEEKQPLGTAGSLYYLPHFIGSLFLVNGDIFGNINFQEFMRKHLGMDAVATMGVYTHEIENPFGVVDVNESVVIGFKEKPIWSSKVNGGVYIIDRAIITQMMDGQPCGMNVFLNNMLQNKKKIAVFDLKEWADIGSPERYFSNCLESNDS